MGKEYSFHGNCYLSNFYVCPVTYKGRTYTNSEAAFQAEKTLVDSEKDAFTNVTPGVAKKMGRHVNLRSDWNEARYSIMLDIVRAKFNQNPRLAEMLVALDCDSIEEDTTGWHDKIWGRCYCSKCNGEGTNFLGKILYQVKQELSGNAIAPVTQGNSNKPICSEMNNKFTFTDEFITRYNSNGVNTYLWRIQRTSDGKLGGFIESEYNLSLVGSCWVDDNAIVMDKATVCDYAVVCDNAVISGNSNVSGNAVISEYAQLTDSATVDDDAAIAGSVHISGNAHVFERASVYGNARIMGNAQIYGETDIFGAYVMDNSKVYGNTKLGSNDIVSGTAELCRK